MCSHGAVVRCVPARALVRDSWRTIGGCPVRRVRGSSPPSCVRVESAPPMTTIPTVPRGYVPQSLDTSPDVDRRLFDRLHVMTEAEKCRHLDAAIHFVEEIAIAGIRVRHPNASPEAVRLRLIAQRLDRATMIRVYGWDPEREGM